MDPIRATDDLTRAASRWFKTAVLQLDEDRLKKRVITRRCAFLPASARAPSFLRPLTAPTGRGANATGRTWRRCRSTLLREMRQQVSLGIHRPPSERMDHARHRVLSQLQFLARDPRSGVANQYF
jgi:hypothetical protein